MTNECKPSECFASVDIKPKQFFRLESSNDFEMCAADIMRILRSTLHCWLHHQQISHAYKNTIKSLTAKYFVHKDFKYFFSIYYSEHENVSLFKHSGCIFLSFPSSLFMSFPLNMNVMQMFSADILRSEVILIPESLWNSV